MTEERGMMPMNHIRRLAFLLAVCLALGLGALAEECAPEGFSFSGGSGKVEITCPAIWEDGGATWARIVFSSPNYPKVVSEGVEYAAEHEGDTSVFVLPVTPDEDMAIVATTTAMSQPHDITYTIHIGATAPADTIVEETAEAPATDRMPIEGLTWERRMPLKYATGFSVDYYEGGYALIDIVDGDRALVIPEEAAVPENLPGDVLVLKRPLKNVYLAATSAMALFDRMGALDMLGSCSLEADGWSVENARTAMEAGDILFAGKYSEPDYELLLQTGCELAIESTMIFHTPKVKEMLETLGIPVLVDRSSYEEHPLGRTEWIRLYAVLAGKEAEAAEFFDTRAAVIDEYAGYPNTEKAVAFFYISSDGSVVVRNVTDYVPKMIEIAGGRYALKDIVDPDSSRSSVSTTMEQFYDAAVDADYLIYNASIAAPLNGMDDLYALSPLFKDFRAVRDGNVWCTGKDLYQETDDVGELIVDIHNMLTGNDEMRFLTRLD